jgi:hypothetical protein
MRMLAVPLHEKPVQRDEARLSPVGQEQRRHRHAGLDALIAGVGCAARRSAAAGCASRRSRRALGQPARAGSGGSKAPGG